MLLPDLSKGLGFLLDWCWSTASESVELRVWSESWLINRMQGRRSSLYTTQDFWKVPQDSWYSILQRKQLLEFSKKHSQEIELECSIKFFMSHKLINILTVLLMSFKNILEDTGLVILPWLLDDFKLAKLFQLTKLASTQERWEKYYLMFLNDL